ncbi:single-stranded-DNA-specific exonuclease RecJ [Novispirillum itersonii]|uniref:Single-stranded-DNA-specific exonuclease RecJ n=1 Tax=Novispirillum itersonii TaxID=189 RepID=A0A7W9ZIQ1_NOVIT|nr:single-stranded-DNA-specific exonuclease RecJ [Novispirillum itersonii]MBB6210879.1 single-stranded-DNA-specific exonuclease [Novispirillum itersonii]
MTAGSFLSVDHSYGGRRWTLRGGDERQALAMSQRLGLPEIVGRVLAARGVTPDEADLFLSPTLKALLPDPSHLRDMDRAVERLVQALKEDETIAVFGDYDVDGATSSALLMRFLRAAGADPVLYIPDRMTEGYGPNAPALLGLRERGVTVAITVDCGITAFEPLQAAAEAGLDVIVVDHHEAEPRLPAAAAVINPKRLDDASPHKHMAAVGVAFLLVVAVNRALRAMGWFGSHRAEPNLMDWLDIVALGTVCDVVPLTGVNRALVTQGLKVMAKRGNPGISALSDVAGVKERPDAYHLGYVLGPRVNAGGRVGQSDLGSRLLWTDSAEEATALALRLHEYNLDRQEIEAAVLFEAIEQAESCADDGSPLILVSGENWHPGVIGIVASRLKERYARPACVVALDGGLAKGSGRSVAGLDLGRAVIAAREAGLLEAGGGHAMAAGFSLKPEKLPEFRAFLAERLRTQLDGGDLSPTLEVDGAVALSGVTPDLLALIERVGPFGAGNEQPRFVIPNVRVGKADVVGSGHVRAFLTGPGGGRLKAIAFKCIDTDLGVALLSSAGMAMHVAGTLRLDTWNGRNECQLVIDDAAPVAS